MRNQTRQTRLTLCVLVNPIHSTYPPSFPNCLYTCQCWFPIHFHCTSLLWFSLPHATSPTHCNIQQAENRSDLLCLFPELMIVVGNKQIKPGAWHEAAEFQVTINNISLAQCTANKDGAVEKGDVVGKKSIYPAHHTQGVWRICIPSSHCM